MVTYEHIKIDPARLRAARGGMKQGEAARALGVSPSRLCFYEGGRTQVPGDVLARMCALYGVQIGALIKTQNIF